MRSRKLLGLVAVLCAVAPGCHKAKTAPDGNELTASGHEIPEPVDNSMIDKENVDPPKPDVK